MMMMMMMMMRKQRIYLRESCCGSDPEEVKEGGEEEEEEDEEDNDDDQEDAADDDVADDDDVTTALELRVFRSSAMKRGAGRKRTASKKIGKGIKFVMRASANVTSWGEKSKKKKKTEHRQSFAHFLLDEVEAQRT